MKPAILLLIAASAAWSATYYLDSRSGNDTNPGTSEALPWRTLAVVSRMSFRPGDRILLRSGSVWKEALEPHSSGTPGAPIVIDRYGAGPFPRIDAGGIATDAVLLRNVQHIELRHLEITNHGDAPAIRRGVHIVADNFGTAEHVVVSDLYIHDVNGLHEEKGRNIKDNGGIIFRTRGGRVPSRFDDLRIERNIIWKVDRSAIAADSYHARRTRWFPSLRVVIRDNFVDEIGGDGIVPWATDGALVEHNIARNCNLRRETYNVGIWPWSTDNTIFQLNEASLTRSTLDGQGFDSDFNSRGTLFQYNYSHDNEGGFMLICTPGKRNPAENVGNIGTVVRNNISRNDRARIFHLSAAEDTKVENNSIYIGPGLDVAVLLTSDWEGWAKGAVFSGNRIYAQGTARYGHGTERRPDGTYGLASGWGPALDIEFRGNRYYGRHIDAPPDSAAEIRPEVPQPTRKWTGPAFDPSKLGDYPDFLSAHRAWLTELLEQEFGAPLRLAPDPGATLRK